MRRALSLLLLAVLVAACDTGDPGGSLYDPDRQSAPDPVLSEVVTDGPVTLAGIDAVTLRGQNFSTEPGKTIVYFEDGNGAVLRGVVLSATATELRVLTPNFPSADLSVRVSVLGAENFSTPMPLVLSPAVVLFGAIVVSEDEEVTGMTRDAGGNLVAALSQGGDEQGIFRFDETTGERTRVAESARPWVDLAYGPDGTLYGVLTNRAVYTIPSTGLGSPFVAVPTADAPPNFTVLASGPDGELWATGADPIAGQTRIYRIAPDQSFQANVPAVADSVFAGTPRDLVVYDGAVYVAAESGGQSRIWRFSIGPDNTLGAGEVVFTAPTRPSNQLPANTTHSIRALAFAMDGTLFVGTNALVDPVYEITAGGSAEVLYPGVITGPVRAFSWGSASGLYYSTPVVPPRVTGGTPTPAQLYTLETRRQGAP